MLIGAKRVVLWTIGLASKETLVSHLSNLEGHVMEGKLPVARLATQPFKVVSP